VVAAAEAAMTMSAEAVTKPPALRKLIFSPATPKSLERLRCTVAGCNEVDDWDEAGFANHMLAHFLRTNEAGMHVCPYCADQRAGGKTALLMHLRTHLPFMRDVKTDPKPSASKPAASATNAAGAATATAPAANGLNGASGPSSGSGSGASQPAATAAAAAVPNVSKRVLASRDLGIPMLDIRRDVSGELGQALHKASSALRAVAALEGTFSQRDAWQAMTRWLPKLLDIVSAGGSLASYGGSVAI
jgi:hypothetical protein